MTRDPRVDPRPRDRTMSLRGHHEHEVTARTRRSVSFRVRGPWGGWTTSTTYPLAMWRRLMATDVVMHVDPASNPG